MTPLAICMVAKYPPIQGGVSQQHYWLAQHLARAGHRVHVVTNAPEVSLDYRMFVPAAEHARMEGAAAGGGYVRLHTTSEVGCVGNYVPYANPFVSKLAALARDVVIEHRCDLIWAGYLEPYGVAGLVASTVTGVPYAVRHAGSDLGTLAQIPARRNLYLDVLRRASLVATGSLLRGTLCRAQVEPGRLYIVPQSACVADGFAAAGDVLDVDAVLDEAAATELAPAHRPSRRFDPSLPTIGFYGKVSRAKGMFELVEALGALAAAGRRFNVLTLVGTRGRAVEALNAAVARAGLGDATYSLPFLPPWMVPRFLRACTAVCCLENRFSIPFHTPQVGFEVLACGTCLVVSEEVRAKSRHRATLADGETALVVSDPRDVASLRDVLARVLDDPAAARALGARGGTAATAVFPAPDVAPVVERLARVVEEAKAMSLEGLQQTLSDLYCDPAFRAALAADTDVALAGRDLDATERAAVREVARRLLPRVARFGAALARKRIGYFLDLFATTAAHLRPWYDELLAAFVREGDFRWRAPAEEVAYVAAFLRRFVDASAACTPPLPAYLRDAIRYDEQLWCAEFAAPEADHEFAHLRELRLDAPDGFGPAPLAPADRIALAPGVVIESFAYPVHRLGAGGPGVAIVPALTVVAFTPRRGAAPARAHVMNDALRRLAQDAAGGRTVADLLDAAVARHGSADAAEVRGAVLRALQQLGAQHIVVRNPGPP